MPQFYDPRMRLPSTQQGGGVPSMGITVGEPYPQQPIPKPGIPSSGQASPFPTVPAPIQKQANIYRFQREISPPAQTAKPKLQITPFMETIFGAMKNIEPTQRGAYLETLEASIKDRLSRYEFRLARGIPLSAEAQAKYNQLKSSFNDIQAYIVNPEPYNAYINTTAANIDQAANMSGQRPSRNMAGNQPYEYTY